MTRSPLSDDTVVKCIQNVNVNNSRFETERARFYSAEIVCALKFLHSKGIVYRLENSTVSTFYQLDIYKFQR